MLRDEMEHPQVFRRIFHRYLIIDAIVRGQRLDAVLVIMQWYKYFDECVMCTSSLLHKLCDRSRRQSQSSQSD